MDPQQNCCGVLLDMWVDESVMHVSSASASNNLCGTCGLMDLSCMFRHQVRARSEGSACKVSRMSSCTERSAGKVAQKSSWTEGSAGKVARKSPWTERSACKVARRAAKARK